MKSRQGKRTAWVVAALTLGGAIAAGCSGGTTNPTTDSGVDSGPTCTAGQTACGLGCTDTTKDPDNCGACGKACTGGQVCSQGACALSCAGGTTQCGQSCIDTKVDSANCGACGKACNAGEACVQGACKSECSSGQTLCTSDGGAYCANTSTDNQNCGACGTTCGTGLVCSKGACASACGGTTTSSDGGAEGGDAGSTSTETFCQPDGGVPYCANTSADNANCGACGNACANGSTCSAGACVACQSVLLISTASTAPAGVVAGLQATSPAFCTIGYYNANAATPPLAALTSYQAILVFDENGAPFSDPAGLGNVMASYFDGGGRVVVALFATGGYGLTGNFGTKYLLIAPQFVGTSSDSYDGTNSAQNLSPNSPALAGVKSITGSGWHGTQVTKNGGAAIAKWASGDLLEVAGTVTDANSKQRNRVDLNIHPTDVGSAGWTGDAFKLLGNALLYQ